MQENIAEKFLDKLVKWSKNIKISDPLEEGCRLGPVVSAGQVFEEKLDCVESYRSVMSQWFILLLLHNLILVLFASV